MKTTFKKLIYLMSILTLIFIYGCEVNGPLYLHYRGYTSPVDHSQSLLEYSKKIDNYDKIYFIDVAKYEVLDNSENPKYLDNAIIFLNCLYYDSYTSENLVSQFSNTITNDLKSSLDEYLENKKLAYQNYAVTSNISYLSTSPYIKTDGKTIRIFFSAINTIQALDGAYFEDYKMLVNQDNPIYGWIYILSDAPDHVNGWIEYYPITNTLIEYSNNGVSTIEF